MLTDPSLSRPSLSPAGVATVSVLAASPCLRSPSSSSSSLSYKMTTHFPSSSVSVAFARFFSPRVLSPPIYLPSGSPVLSAWSSRQWRRCSSRSPPACRRAVYSDSAPSPPVTAQSSRERSLSLLRRRGRCSQPRALLVFVLGIFRSVAQSRLSVFSGCFDEPD